MNRPVPISVFSDQHRTKSTTRSRTSCGTHTWVRAPQDFFLSDMLGHQFSQHFVFGLDLLFQKLDPLLFSLVIRPAPTLKGSRTVLEELFLPTVEHRWLQSMFLAQIGNRHFIQQVPPQDGNLLFSGVVLSLSSHAFLSVILTEE